MKKQLKSISILGLLIVLLLVTLVGCGGNDGYFYVDESGYRIKVSKNMEECYISGLSQQILDKTELILPTTLDKKIVKGFDEIHDSNTVCNICGNNANIIKIKKFFIYDNNYEFNIKGSLGDENYFCLPSKDSKKVFLSSNPSDYTNGFVYQSVYADSNYYPYSGSNTPIYVRKDCVKDFETLYPDSSFKAANVTYYLWHESDTVKPFSSNESANESAIYFIDDVEIGDRIITRPLKPQSGLKFEGWFTDVERTQPLDFDTFVMQTDELNLYAKWVRF